MNGEGKLKLRAADAEDLAVISACLQDAVVPVKDMLYLPDDGQFIMVVNRFRWEAVDGPPVEGKIYERVHSGIRFDRVGAVRRKGLDRSRAGHVLALLAIEAADGHVDLLFSASAAIRLEVSGIMCHLDDIDEPWPTQWRPQHPLDGD